MRKPFIHYGDELRQALAQGTVVTDTFVQAREIRLACNLEHQSQSVTLWRAPKVVTFNQWLESSYTDLSRIGWVKASRELIDNEVLHHLMEQAALEEDYLRHAASAVDAWNIYHSWFLDRVPRGDLLQTENSRIWMKWLANTKELLADHKLISIAEVTPLLAEAASAEIWLPQSSISFFGRDDRTRAQDELIHLLATRGADVASITPSPASTSEKKRVSFDSPQAEWTSIAWWVREQLTLHGNNHRIGIICNNLSGNHSRIKHRFEAVFPEIDNVDAVVEINSGMPLMESPLCRDLLAFFSWLCYPISSDEYKTLSLSRYLNALELPPSGSATPLYFQSFALQRGTNQMKNVAALVGESAERSLIDWIGVLRQILLALDWRQVSDEEGGRAVQARIGFGNLLNNVARFSGFEGTCTLNRAVELIRDQARSANHPSPPRDANVQVLNQEQSVGLEFDSLWVANMSDVEWPPAADPNPMIPIRVLREAVVSKTTPRQMLNWSKGLTRDWQSCSSLMIFSHSSELEDENHEASHLLRDIDDVEHSLILKDTTFTRHEHVWSPSTQQDVIQEFPADTGNKLPKSHYGRQRTSMLKNQAQCPFRGWAVNRLKLEPPEETGAFLEAVHRGSMVHDVLQRIIETADTQEKLAQTAEQTIRNVVSEIVDAYIAKEKFELGKKYIENEKELIVERMLLWQTSELDRPPWSVFEVEKERSIAIGKFEFNMRVDRIDELGNSKKVVIDYKTGTVTPKDWNPERPIEPQMPLYANAVAKSHAVVYELIASDKTSYKGCSSKDLKIDGVKTAQELYGRTFSALKKEWRSSLVEIIKEFETGRAVVDPQDNGKVCQYCHLEDFCRVFDDIRQESPIPTEGVEQ